MNVTETAMLSSEGTWDVIQFCIGWGISTIGYSSSFETRGYPMKMNPSTTP